MEGNVFIGLAIKTIKKSEQAQFPLGRYDPEALRRGMISCIV